MSPSRIMGFFSFWWQSVKEAFSSAWGVVGGVDLLITVLGAIAYEAGKEKGPEWLKKLLNHAALSDKWRLAALFMGWFLFSTLLLAPYWQFKKAEKNVSKYEQIIKSENDSVAYGLTLENLKITAPSSAAVPEEWDITFSLKNHTPKPIVYNLESLEFDKTPQVQRLLNRRGSAPVGGEGMFVLAPLSVDTNTSHVLSVVVSYGLPNVDASRRLKQTIQIPAGQIPLGDGQSTYLNLDDDDSPAPSSSIPDTSTLPR